jgi:hypothetical protein
VSNIFNIYCDESCHLENDKQSSMVLGTILCPMELVRQTSIEIKKIKLKYNLSSYFETKWGKISPAKEDFYLEIINYFFDKTFLSFRALIIPDKSKIEHERFNQTHDDWYYKMYYQLLKEIITPENSYNIFIDIKDTKSIHKLRKLHDILCTSISDNSKSIIKDLIQVRSHEIELMQLADLLIGAVSYTHRNLNTSQSKVNVISAIENKSGHSLKMKTYSYEKKLNLFIWEAK